MILFLLNLKLNNMKSTVKFILALASLLILFTCTSYAQTDFSGEQTRGQGSDATLRCDGIKLDAAMQIVKVSGLNAGFWITDQYNTVLYRCDDMTQGVGVKLNPGIYYVYPNLVEGHGKAYITLTLK